MKITKSRLLQIIREEVELHEKNLEENVYELDEETLDDAASEEEADVDGDGNVSRAEANAVFNAEAAKDEENPPNKLMIKLIEEKDDKRVVKDTYKGKTYKTSKSIAKAMKGKKHPRTAAAKAASSWAKNRYAVAQAAKIATTGTAKSKKKKKTEEDRLFGPKDSKGKRPIIQPEKNGGKIEKKQDDI